MPPKKIERRAFVRYSSEIAEKICAGLAEGRKLRSICADEGMPAQGTVFRWLAAHADFRTFYDDARKGNGGTRYSPQLASAICEALVEGRSLRSICTDDDMPGKSTVFRWLAEHAEFRVLYARAREVQADTLFDETLEIADDARNDWMERRTQKDASWVANGENIQRSKLRIDTRKWFVAKLSPKKYGDKVELAGTPEVPVVKVVREIVKARRKKGATRREG
jgi:hypothetical protein